MACRSMPQHTLYSLPLAPCRFSPPFSPTNSLSQASEQISDAYVSVGVWITTEAWRHELSWQFLGANSSRSSITPGLALGAYSPLPFPCWDRSGLKMHIACATSITHTASDMQLPCYIWRTLSSYFHSSSQALTVFPHPLQQPSLSIRRAGKLSISIFFHSILSNKNILHELFWE